MLKAYKYRIYPTDLQRELISKHFGSCRFVFNLALETKQYAYASNRINLSCFDLIKQLPDLKNECTWLKEINSQSLQQSIVNLDTAFTKFFKGQANFPKFKKKYSVNSFTIPQRMTIEDCKLIIPKFKEGIKIVTHRSMKGEIKQAIITKTSTQKYFVSIVCDTKELSKAKCAIKEKTTVGIDLGIKSFVATSAGHKFTNPKHLRIAIKKIKYVQRRHSKYKGKRNRHRLAILHEKLTNKRKDFLHKTSIKLIRDNQSLAIEDLNIKGMVQNHKLAQSIVDCSWGTFVSMLKYKADWYGRNILQIGRFEPSSKTCSHCGKENKELTLDDRQWECKYCSKILDRDINAAINIKNFALRNYLSVERRLKNRNELLTLVGVMTSETVAK